MQPQGASKPGAAREVLPSVTPEIASEAAVWVARLHGPDRTKSMERECLAWQARSAAHRLAFERCTDTWQDVAGLTLSTYATAARLQMPDRPEARSNTRRAALSSAVVASAALLAWRPWAHDKVYDTGIGEQRVVVLVDGTRMTLNTATSVSVSLTKTRRSVSVLHGEALFEVAKDPDRPFLVQVADASVVATGTSFLVRSTSDGNINADAFGVTLIEGQVIVQLVRQHLLPQIGRGVHEDTHAVRDVYVHRRTQPAIVRVGRAAGRAGAADHRHPVRGASAEQRGPALHRSTSSG